MTKLRHLVAEVDAALDIYLAGRTGQQFNKVAYILADDCCELASKLYLITQDPAWSDATGNNRFKSFKAVTAEVRASCPGAADLTRRIEGRRERRNGFFHSAHLLDLTLQSHDVKEALRDVIDYGSLLFGDAWNEEVSGTRNFETAEVLLRLDCLSYADPALPLRIASVFANLPRTVQATPKERGCEVAKHPDDHHLRLAVRNGGKQLRDRLQALLP
jgi:hypothetical protein